MREPRPKPGTQGMQAQPLIQFSSGKRLATTYPFCHSTDPTVRGVPTQGRMRHETPVHPAATSPHPVTSFVQCLVAFCFSFPTVLSLVSGRRFVGTHVLVYVAHTYPFQTFQTLQAVLGFKTCWFTSLYLMLPSCPKSQGRLFTGKGCMQIGVVFRNSGHNRVDDHWQIMK